MTAGHGKKRHGLILDQPLDDPHRCHDCDGACCRAFPNVHLHWDEYLRLQSLGAQRLEWSPIGDYCLVTENGCEFLANGRCAIYADRPEICRRFYCADLPERSS